MSTSAKQTVGGFAVGTTLLGKYRVESILGEGGMGLVIKARHLVLDEQVAIKCLRDDVKLDQEAIARFMREAQAAVKLKSEHVARVSDVGTFDNGTPFIVMEYLDGQDLEVFMREAGTINPALAIELMLQATEALAEAHSIGIVHRDIKPTNLFITWRPDGSPLLKVLDFGISKSPMGADLSLTQTQSLLGTPAYMSPEQMRSARAVDARTDIWSLGTVLYEVLEGHRPFEAESFSEMCVKVAVDAPTPMVAVPAQLADVVYRCLAKAPEQRFANVAEMAAGLVPFTREPEQARRSVERMQRMLRRAPSVWDPDSSDRNSRPDLPRSDFGNERTPAPSAAMWAPGRVSAAGFAATPGSNPAATPFAPPSGAAAAAGFASAPASQPAAVPYSANALASVRASSSTLPPAATVRAMGSPSAVVAISDEPLLTEDFRLSGARTRKPLWIGLGVVLLALGVGAALALRSGAPTPGAAQRDNGTATNGVTGSGSATAVNGAAPADAAPEPSTIGVPNDANSGTASNAPLDARTAADAMRDDGAGQGSSEAVQVAEPKSGSTSHAAATKDHGGKKSGRTNKPKPGKPTVPGKPGKPACDPFAQSGNC